MTHDRHDTVPTLVTVQPTLAAELRPLAAKLVERVKEVVPEVGVEATAATVDRLSVAVALAAQALDEPARLQELARAWIPILRRVGLEPTHLKLLAGDIAGLVATLAADANVPADDDQWSRADSTLVENLVATGDDLECRDVTEQPEAIEALLASSRQIADIAGVIDELAFRTDLLALNVAVRAAHVGEQDQGLAAMAAEVRTLAQRSARAAKEIAQQNTTIVARITP